MVWFGWCLCATLLLSLSCNLKIRVESSPVSTFWSRRHSPIKRLESLQNLLSQVTTTINNQVEVHSNQAPTKFRNILFWKGVLCIYCSYKMHQIKIGFRHSIYKILRRSNVSEIMEKEKHEWDEIHEKNSVRMLELCLRLRGFYLKTGQFLATRRDFMPDQYTTKLSQLQDDIPHMCEREVREIIEKELVFLHENNELSIERKDLNSNSIIDDVFDMLELHKPVGSASIAQVHRGFLKNSVLSNGPVSAKFNPKTSTVVAVKVQNSQAFALMSKDLVNLQRLAQFLRRSGELNFDVLSAVKELSNQMHLEFDFDLEASHLSYFGSLFEQYRKKIERKSKFLKLTVAVPKPILSTKKLLIMTFLPGENIAQKLQNPSLLTNTTSSSKWIRSQIFRDIVHTVGEVWAVMLFAPRFIDEINDGKIVHSQDNSFGPELGANQSLFNKMGMGIEGRDWEAGVFHADPHPGNLLLQVQVPPSSESLRLFSVFSNWMKKASLGILDWGQVKRLKPYRLTLLAELFVAIHEYNSDKFNEECRINLAQAFLKLGIKVAQPQDVPSLCRMALTMFDTIQSDQSLVADPFSSQSAIRENPVQHLPSDLFFVLRTVQILRGFASSLNRIESTNEGNCTKWSLAEQWAPYARNYLNNKKKV